MTQKTKNSLLEALKGKTKLQHEKLSPEEDRQKKKLQAQLKKRVDEVFKSNT